MLELDTKVHTMYMYKLISYTYRYNLKSEKSQKKKLTQWLKLLLFIEKVFPFFFTLKMKKIKLQNLVL